MHAGKRFSVCPQGFVKGFAMAEVYVKIRRGKVDHTTTLGRIGPFTGCGKTEFKGEIVCDWSKTGKLLGIEILGAKQVKVDGRTVGGG